VPLLLNDHGSLAHLGDGVHLGQADGPCDRAALPPGALIGRSTHDLQQLAAAIAEGVDYVGFGPVFVTTTKVGALPARGLEALAAVVAASTIPVVAIGGLELASMPQVRATGVAGWAVISAILAAPDPTASARAFAAVATA
jgi:thiamine-phosphate pyrophosphorylase